MSIGDNIKKIRKLKGLKQSELAELSNVSRVAIGNYERGDRIPNIDILRKIATALEVSIGDLTVENINKKHKFNNTIQFARNRIHNETTANTYKVFLFNGILENLGYKANADRVGLHIFIQDINTKEEVARIDNSDFYDIAYNTYWIVENIVENMINNNLIPKKTNLLDDEIDD